MKTKVRTQATYDGNYHHVYVQILGNKYPHNLSKTASKYLTVIGTISWQGNASEMERADRWYSINFECNTDNPDHLFAMAKLAKYIKDNTYHSVQPEEVKLLIGAEEHFSHVGEFVPVSYVGMSFFKVMKGDTYETSIIAANEIAANKEYARLKLEGNLIFDHVIAKP